MKPKYEERLRQVSARATESLTHRFGNDLGIWYGCGYPKSGTVWLCELLSSYLYLPYPQNYLTPVLMKSVIHSHWHYSPKRDRCVYIVRDGRDVMVSFYFHWLNQLRSGRSPQYAESRRDALMSRLPTGVDFDDVQRALPHYMELEFSEPRGSKVNWGDHVSDWLGGDRSNVSTIRYERLIADGPAELGPAIKAFAGELDEERLRIAFDLLDFQRRTGRASGEEDSTSFRRKGVSGDWRNHFGEEAVEVFKRHAQRGLELAGYESDDSWEPGSATGQDGS